ncbi:hypothetical protein [Vibrio owensii]|uniref:hypothetical protein n=1 Tax=Vibrio owensii TaxID=696485 RepID=UPI0018F1A780|nr:hypothetical protein [Vibrio owensii]
MEEGFCVFLPDRENYAAEFAKVGIRFLPELPPNKLRLLALALHSELKWSNCKTMYECHSVIRKFVPSWWRQKMKGRCALSFSQLVRVNEAAIKRAYVPGAHLTPMPEERKTA